MILVLEFDLKCDIIVVPDRLDYNVPKLRDDFLDWIEVNPKYTMFFRDGDYGFCYDGRAFIAWLNECVLDKTEHVRVIKLDAMIEEKHKYKKKRVLHF